MKVQEVMNLWVKTVTPETKVSDVAAIMCLHRIPGLPVVVEGDRLVGMIAEKDLLHHLFPQLDELMNGFAKTDFEAMESDYSKLSHVLVKDLMTTRVVTVPTDMPILRATSIMVQNRFRRIPVADKGRLKGVLSLGDVHKALFRKSLEG